jgi:hypothetical protein
MVADGCFQVHAVECLYAGETDLWSLAVSGAFTATLLSAMLGATAKIMHSSLLLGLSIAAAAACSFNEPSDVQMRAMFELHRPLLDDTRQLFEQDTKRHNLTRVTTGGARCSDRPLREPCLAADRWQEYASRLKRMGVQTVELHETPGIYFFVYRSPWTNSFRYRGFVYAPGVPRVVHNHDDTEERVDLGDGWFSFLIIDT